MLKSASAGESHVAPTPDQILSDGESQEERCVGTKRSGACRVMGKRTFSIISPD